MHPVGFDPITPKDERPQTYNLDRETIGTGNVMGEMEWNVQECI
jgi:hypothetical protein